MEELLAQLRDLSGDNRSQLLEALGATGSSAAANGGSSRQQSSRNPDSFFHRKLRLFSGKFPVPNGEVDYVSWRMQVTQIQGDDEDTLSDVQLKRLILQSLQRPALDATRNTTGGSSEILTVLDTLYGSVADGQELLIQFFTTYQQEKEIASTYLQRLYLQVMDVADKGGITVGDVPGHLVRQFVRGSHDEILIHKLGLEETLDHPKGFAEVLLSIRKEEARRTEKRLRLKVGRVATQNVSPVASPKPERASAKPPSNKLSDDKQQIADLTSRLASMESMLQQHHASMPPPNSSLQLSELDSTPTRFSNSHCSRSRGKPWDKKNKKVRRTQFCYKCGQDGHYADKCVARKNPELVQQKLLSGSGN